MQTGPIAKKRVFNGLLENVSLVTCRVMAQTSAVCAKFFGDCFEAAAHFLFHKMLGHGFQQLAAFGQLPLGDGIGAHFVQRLHAAWRDLVEAHPGKCAVRHFEHWQVFTDSAAKNILQQYRIGADELADLCVDFGAAIAVAVNIGDFDDFEVKALADLFNSMLAARSSSTVLEN